MANDHWCKEYDDNCPGCQPAIADAKTGRKIPDDDPIMIAVRAFWKTVPMEQKRAYQRVMCHNSRTEEDLSAVATVGQGMQEAMARVSSN
jgi:hypothetical protein